MPTYVSVTLLGSLLILTVMISTAQLKIGFYSQTCPAVETIVRSVVRDVVNSDSDMAAVLLRLHFHDCFVEGCDGSILVDNGANSEKNAFGHQGVRGFDVIDKVKEVLEEGGCRGVVSCADIVALAARDAVVLSRGQFYNVETGRRDGRVSDLTLAADMPDVDDSIKVLVSKFKRKGLSHQDLVLLSSAHTIGTTACFFLTKRLYNFSGGSDSDPAINSNFLPRLMATCPKDGDVNVRLAMDPVSNRIFDDQILRNIEEGSAVIGSDARLMDDSGTRAAVESYVGKQRTREFLFGSDFGSVILKMGRIGVKTGSDGEIRRVCNAFN